MLEKDGNDQLERSCEKCRRVEEEGNILHTIKRRKAKLEWSYLRLGTAFYSILLTEDRCKDRRKGADEEEEADSYWMTLKEERG